MHSCLIPFAPSVHQQRYTFLFVKHYSPHWGCTDSSTSSDIMFCFLSCCTIHFLSLCWSNRNYFLINCSQALFKNGYIKRSCLPFFFRCLSNNPIILTQIQISSLVSEELKYLLATSSLILQSPGYLPLFPLLLNLIWEDNGSIVTISKHSVPSRCHLWDTCMSNTRLTLFLGFLLLDKLSLLFSFFLSPCLK